MTDEPKSADAQPTPEKSERAFAEPVRSPELKSSSADVAKKPDAATEEMLANEGIVQRRSPWYSSLAALRYVSSLSKDDDVKVRDSDRFTSMALAVTSVLTVLSLAIPALAPHRLLLVLICDGLVGLMLLLYVTNRFGIVNTLNPRQALLTWQLMMGAGFLGIFATINLAVCIALIVARATDLPH